MSETAIVTPLSGEEIVEATVNAIRRGLKRDCHLNPMLAYEAFELEVLIQLKLKDNGREPLIEQRAFLAQHASLLIEVAPFEVRLRLEALGPNVVREEAGLPIPTLIEDASGRKEVRNVQYQTPAGKQTQTTTEKEPVPKPAEKPPLEKPPAPKPQAPPVPPSPEEAARRR